MTRSLILSRHNPRQHCLHSRLWRREFTRTRRASNELPCVSVCMTKILKGRARTLQNGFLADFDDIMLLLIAYLSVIKKRKKHR